MNSLCCKPVFNWLISFFRRIVARSGRSRTRDVTSTPRPPPRPPTGPWVSPGSRTDMPPYWRVTPFRPPPTSVTPRGLAGSGCCGPRESTRTSTSSTTARNHGTVCYHGDVCYHSDQLLTP